MNRIDPFSFINYPLFNQRISFSLTPLQQRTALIAFAALALLATYLVFRFVCSQEYQPQKEEPIEKSDEALYVSEEQPAVKSTPSPTQKTSVTTPKAEKQATKPPSSPPSVTPPSPVHSPKVDKEVKKEELKEPSVNLEQLEDLVDRLNYVTNDLKAPIHTLATLMSPLTVEELTAKADEFLVTILQELTPTKLRSEPAYLKALQQFVIDFPDSNFFPFLELKDSGNKIRRVNKLLACTLSPVIESACESKMKEGKGSYYQSPDFDEGILDIVADYIQMERFRFYRYSKNDDVKLVNTYHAARCLQIESLLKKCHEVLKCENFTQLRMVAPIAQTYDDPYLAMQCLICMRSLGPAKYNDPIIPHKLKDLCQELEEIQTYTNVKLEIDNHELAAGVDDVNLKVLQFCQAIQTERLRINEYLDDSCYAIFKGLKGLYLHGNVLQDTSKGCKIIEEVLTQPTLHSLIMGSQADDNQKLFKKLEELLIKNKTLLRLHISGCITDVSFMHIVKAIEQNHSLQSIHLNLDFDDGINRYNDLDDSHLKILADALIKNNALQTLTLSNQKCTLAAKMAFVEEMKKRPLKLSTQWE